MKKLWNNKIKVLWYSHPRIAIALTLVFINLAVIGVFLSDVEGECSPSILLRERVECASESRRAAVSVSFATVWTSPRSFASVRMTS